MVILKNLDPKNKDKDLKCENGKCSVIRKPLTSKEKDDIINSNVTSGIRPLKKVL